MLHYITISDENSNAIVETEVNDLAAALTEWFPEAPAEVTDAIEDLQSAAKAGNWERADRLAHYLMIVINR
ncbi:hypothetical protein ACTHAM_002337 [Cellulomonas soli]|uniref:hypothetical protein n=1 Tax=Cellulomonas soli TaxID=931535 RepID=UPI003F849BC2